MKPKTQINPKISGRIKQRRIELHMTQAQLAELINRNVQAVNLYETEKQGVPSDVISKISTALKTHPDYLLGRCSEPDEWKHIMQTTEANMRDFCEGNRQFCITTGCLQKVFKSYFGYRVISDYTKTTSVWCLRGEDGEEFFFRNEEFSEMLEHMRCLVDGECRRIKRRREFLNDELEKETLSTKEQREMFIEDYLAPFLKDAELDGVTEEERCEGTLTDKH